MGLVQVGIAAVALGVVGLFVVGQALAGRGETAAGRRRTVALSALGAAAWLGLWGALAGSGVLRQFDARPPPLMALFPGTVGLGLWLGLSGVGRRLATGLPVGAVIVAQGFRVPLEWVMHQAAMRGVMPVQMSWSGYNFDVVTGASALVVGALALRGKAPRALLWGWTTLSFATLLTVMSIGLLSTPLVHAFGSQPEQLNTWVADAPFVWLPTVMVAFALASQVVVVRALIGPPTPTAVAAVAISA